MKKVLLSFLLIISLTLSCVSVYAEEASVQTEVSDVKFDAVRFLNSIGILQGDEQGNLNPEKNVTRAEFTALLLRIFKYDNMGSPYKQEFNDVTENMWFAPYISIASSLGLVNGYGNGNFGPNDYVSFEQACKIIVNAFGYGQSAESKGGFPTGYLQIATSLGISKGVAVSSTLARRDIAKMLVNSLEAKFLEQEEQGETLESFLDLEKKQGIVESVFGASINPYYNDIKEGNIVISGEMYKTTVDNIQQFIGLSVQFYTMEENGEKVVKYIWSKHNDLLVVDAYDIEDSTTNNKFVYRNSKNKLNEISIPQNTVIIYNGQVPGSGEDISALLKPDMGTVTLVNNDGDSTYEVIFIEEYKNIVFLNSTDEVLYDYLGNSINIEDCESLEIYKEGLLISVAELNRNDIISVISSKDGKHIVCYVSSNTDEGTIETFDADDYIFELDGDNGIASYEMSEEYKKYFISGNSKITKLVPGDSAIFYLDYSGKIAMSEKIIETDSELKYGYMLEYEAGNGPSGIAYLRVLTDNNRIEVFESATKKIKFGYTDEGGYNVKKVAAKDVLPKVANEKGKVTKQLLQYSLDESGYLTGIFLKAPAKNDDYISLDSTEVTSYYTNSTLNKEYFVDGATKVFKIPYEGAYERYLASGNINQFVSNNSSISLEIYDVKDFHVGALVLTNDVTLYEATNAGKEVVIDKVNSPVMYIESVRTQCTEDDVWYTVIRGYQNKEYTEVLVSDTLSSNPETMKQLVPGAVIQYEVNYPDQERALTIDDDRVMIMYTVLFNCNNKSADLYQNWNYTEIFNQKAMITTTFAQVNDISEETFYATFTKGAYGTVTTPFVIYDGSFVLKYDTETRKFTVGNRYDIAPGQKVFIRERYNNLREVVIVD